MEKELEIYITYDEADDSNWAFQFRDYLKQAAEEINGAPLSIKSMNDFSPSQIKEGKSYVLLIILSNDSKSSNTIINDIELFQQAFHANKKNGHGIKSNFKLIKILKSPIKYHDQPSSVRDLDAFEFFFQNIDEQDNLYAGSDEKSIHNDYWIQVTSLVYNIYELAVAEKKTKKKSVYLANCSRDFLAFRQIIKMELVREGYLVLPNRTYPDDAEIAKELMEKDIHNSILSIHLLGVYVEENLYQSFSLSDIQYQVAANHENSEFQKLIWTIPEIEFVDEEQKSFFEMIKRDCENKTNSSILQSTLEELKDFMKALLSKDDFDFNTALGKKVQTETPIVYLIYDLKDRDHGQKLIKTFKKQGCKVLHPDFNHDHIKAREAHKMNLEIFDVAVVYCKESNEKWLQMKLMELMKSPGYGRQKPVQVKLLIARNEERVLKMVETFNVDFQTIYGPEELTDTHVIEIINQPKILQMIRY